MGKKLIITAALCGAGTMKSQTPYVPVTPEEIAADVVACAVAVVKAGASVIHIHVRDDEGKNTMETERFCHVVNLVREELAKANLDAVLNLTSSGSKFSEDMRLAHLPILKPEMCSYDPGSMNWANSYIFANSPSFLERLGTLCQKEAIKPECEVFDGGIEAGDHLTHHAGELDGLAAIDGGVELRAVVEGARVVDLDLLAFVAHQELLSRECNAHQSTRAVRAFPFAARNLLQVATSP